MTKTGADGTELQLVVRFLLYLSRLMKSKLIDKFSDEFNTDGRTFYSDDDPYFQAVDLWYGVTQDLEVFITRSALSLGLTHIMLVV